MRRLARECEALQLLRAYLHFLEGSRFVTSQELREATRGHVIDLAVLALRSHSALGESCLGAVAAARLSAALGWITAHCEEPELTLTAVARSQGISPRHLQRLLYESGTSFTALVNELRLQRAFALLAEASSDRLRISDIALQVGFSDISHFNRLFRSRFGDTPTGIRGQGGNRCRSCAARPDVSPLQNRAEVNQLPRANSRIGPKPDGIVRTRFCEPDSELISGTIAPRSPLLPPEMSV